MLQFWVMKPVLGLKPQPVLHCTALCVTWERGDFRCYVPGLTPVASLQGAWNEGHVEPFG